MSAATSGGRREGFPAETAVYKHRAILGWFPLGRSPRESSPRGDARDRSAGNAPRARPGGWGCETRLGLRVADVSAPPPRSEGKSAAGSRILVMLPPRPHPRAAARDWPVRQRGVRLSGKTNRYHRSSLQASENAQRPRYCGNYRPGQRYLLNPMI